MSNSRMVSYAQNAEDVVLSRAFRGQQHGFWVDVGAHDPTIDSVTRHFADRGWAGINVEPQTHYHRALQRERRNDVNLNIGVGADGGRLTLYLVPEAPGMATFSKARAEWLTEMGYGLEERVVQIRTLNDVFAEHVGDRTVDFVNVDVEQFEEEVLGGLDLTRWRPRVLVVESYPDVSPWELRLVAAGYTRTLWDGINLFFVRDEDHAELGQTLSRPATMALDAFDPWPYVEQRQRLEQTLGSVLGDSLTTVVASAVPASAHGEVKQACRVLGRVLAHRMDVVDHFGIPRRGDVNGLFRWASRVHLREGEPHVQDLAPHAGVYAALGDSLPVRASLGGVARATLRRHLRRLARATRLGRKGQLLARRWGR